MNSLIQLKSSGVIYAAFAVTTVLCATQSKASLVGRIWENDPDSNNAAIVPSDSLPNAQFASPTINYQINNSDSTSIATFLNNPVFFGQQNGFDPSHFANNTFIQLTGTIFLNAGDNSFVVAHDDGVVLTIPGISATPVVNKPDPTSEDFTPFHVIAPVAGDYEITLNYTECCAGPADLVMELNNEPVSVGNQVPDATATLPLLALASGCLAMFGRRLKR